MKECIFCKIAQKQVPATVEFETENVVAFKNINPVAEVHILVIPKVHVGGFMQLTDELVMAEMTKVAKTVISQKKIQDGYKLVFNGGKYQAVPHLHWHILGGKLEDESEVLNKT